MDQLFFLDMQKDTVVQSIGSIMLDPTGGNHPVVLHNITDVIVVQGRTAPRQPWAWAGNLDIGLLDTMEDLFVNFIGALTFSIIGYFYVRSRGKGKFAKRFIPVAKNSAMPDVSEMAETRSRRKKKIRQNKQPPACSSATGWGLLTKSYLAFSCSSLARASMGLRYWPVKELGFSATSSGVPVATTVPPPLAALGAKVDDIVGAS